MHFCLLIAFQFIQDVQPSSFCVYKFFDLPDQDTAIVPASKNPVFSDHRTFSIFINANIEKYLESEVSVSNNQI